MMHHECGRTACGVAHSNLCGIVRLPVRLSRERTINDLGFPGHNPNKAQCPLLSFHFLTKLGLKYFHI